jgi:uncharacterized membrane protein
MFVFLLSMALLLPLLMIIIGRLWQNNPPKEVNSFYGYRTTRSMKSKETWDFAHRYYGRIWLITGIVLTPLTLFGMFLLRSDYEVVSIILLLIQTLVITLEIIPTEAALKKNFDEYGYRIK